MNEQDNQFITEWVEYCIKHAGPGETHLACFERAMSDTGAASYRLPAYISAEIRRRLSLD